ncbi:hypothetical protein I7I50_06133 [Histoplasma capsulatum G186AR]|uniref:Uncharacterized protein n=1 Tax=Ajellomyces capsulatus TaxID=5037 RepID=A0A8H7YZW0_AJECA|nr:hypothetical protein I7I52_10789 [Histoplasma capsulatum]QSS67138.1 hypothetical protein I7I50_06133 [Histoplasma capsulatum G186AR]
MPFRASFLGEEGEITRCGYTWVHIAEHASIPITHSDKHPSNASESSPTLPQLPKPDGTLPILTFVGTSRRKL